MSFGAEALLGYKYGNEQALIIPMAGFRLTRINDGGYKETGANSQNLSIMSKAMTKVELIAGARIAASSFDLGGVILTPEVHGFINQDLTGKNPKATVSLINGQTLETRNNKPNRTYYNVGTSLNTMNGNMEYGVGFDARLANKYSNLQGTLKIRANF